MLWKKLKYVLRQKMLNHKSPFCINRIFFNFFYVMKKQKKNMIANDPNKIFGGLEQCVYVCNFETNR